MRLKLLMAGLVGIALAFAGSGQRISGKLPDPVARADASDARLGSPGYQSLAAATIDCSVIPNDCAVPVYQSLPADGQTYDLADWMKTSYPGSDQTHLTSSQIPGFTDGHWSGNTIYLTTCYDVGTSTGNLERYHYNSNWVFLNLVYRPVVCSTDGAWYYRRFCNATNCNQFKWGRRSFATGNAGKYATTASWMGCHQGEPPDFRNIDMDIFLWGAVTAPYTQQIYNPQTGWHDVKAIILEHRRDKISERYWYGKSTDGSETYGLIRWDRYQRTAPGNPWIYCGGGCQNDQIVSIDSVVPWSILSIIDSVGYPNCAVLP